MDIISSAITLVSPSALPLLLVILFYIKIKNDRKSTKESRDQESTELRDKLTKHDFMISQLKDNQTLQAQILEDLRDAVSAMNIGVAKLEVSVTTLTEAVKEIKR